MGEEGNMETGMKNGTQMIEVWEILPWMAVLLLLP